MCCVDRLSAWPSSLGDQQKRWRGRRSRVAPISLLSTLIALAAATTTVRAAVPLDVGYQGRLLDADGRPLPGPVDLELRVFAVPDGGTAIYSEQQSDITLVDGVFHLLLGTGTAQSPRGGLEAGLTGGVDHWLELVVDGEVLAPRQPFGAVPFAFEADLLGGKHLTNLVQKNEAGSISAPMLASGAVTTASLAPGAVTTANLANASVTAAKVQGGPGSGLDADTVDGISGSAITALQSQVATLQTQLATAQGQITGLQTLLAGVSRNGDTLLFSGMNMQLVSGAGATDAPPNALGNLIVGYDELRDDGPVQRTGSHNLVLGAAHDYTSYGGLVAGFHNSATGAYASVSGGSFNTASGSRASVSGGSANSASGTGASIVGGRLNSATGFNAAVGGGAQNVASAAFAAASGGLGNLAGPGTVDLLPFANPGDAPSVSGGIANHASAVGDSVSGGTQNVAEGGESSVSGGVGNRAIGGTASVSGGDHNVAGGDFSSVSGGARNNASGGSASVSGGDSNEASGFLASVGGGYNNVAGGTSSSVTGGSSNNAAELNSSISGGSGVGFVAPNGWKAGSVGAESGPNQFFSQ